MGGARHPVPEVDFLRIFQEMDDWFRSQARRLLFHRLAQQAVAIEPMPYSLIIGAPVRPKTTRSVKGITTLRYWDPP